MVEGTKEKYNVEAALGGFIQFIDTDFRPPAAGFLIAQNSAAQIKSIPGLPLVAPQLAEVIAEIINGQHFTSPSPQGFKSPITVPGAHVQNPLSIKVFGDFIS